MPASIKNFSSVAISSSLLSLTLGSCIARANPPTLSKLLRVLCSCCFEEGNVSIGFGLDSYLEVEKSELRLLEGLAWSDALLLGGAG